MIDERKPRLITGVFAKHLFCVFERNHPSQAKMLYSICYFSTANASLSDTDFKNLFDNIIKKNAANNITGVLVFDGGNFMQILEGSKIDVIDTYNKIAKDERHHTIIKVAESDYPDRIFAKYDYGFKIVDNKNSINDLKKYADWLELYGTHETNKFISLLENFLSHT